MAGSLKSTVVRGLQTDTISHLRKSEYAQGGYVVSRMKIILCAIAILIMSSWAAGDRDQPSQAPTKAVQLTGLVGVKNNTKGNLTIENGALRFTHSQKSSDLAPSSMQDVVTGDDSQRVIRGTLGTLSMFGPYGSGRFLSLFRSKLDTLTIQYRDPDEGLHGVIFTTPVGTAEAIKEKLVAAGAHTSVPVRATSAANIASPPNAEPALRPQKPGSEKIDASAIEIMMIQSDEIKLPAEFQIALYENLIQQMQKKGGFQHVYRDGERGSAGAPNLVVLHSTVRGFKKGSERARQVTTVAGATSITVHCAFTDKDGRLLLERDIKGNVRLFGGNLRATYDFAKKAAKVTRESTSRPAGT
jgi:hypothetical protein